MIRKLLCILAISCIGVSVCAFDYSVSWSTSIIPYRGNVEVLIKWTKVINSSKFYKIRDFLAEEVGSEYIADSIIEVALKKEVPVLRAFAIAYAESGYKAHTISYNRRSRSKDIGLFQINNRAFNNYSERSLLEIHHNIVIALSHYHNLLAYYRGNSDLASLAYNAGVSRVDNLVIPQSSLAYINKIQQKQQELEIGIALILHNAH